MDKFFDSNSDTLTREQFEILKTVYKDPFAFSSHCKVIHPQRGKVKFDLYEYQKAVLWAFLTRRFNIILKFRQAGITELMQMFALWLAMYHAFKNIQIISIKDRVAKKFLKRIKFTYKNLEPFLQVPIINGRKGDYGTATEIEFINGSTITSVPTTEDSGRSEAASLLIMDEAAIVRWASAIWASAFPTLSTGGSAILASTPYGTGNFFHKMWVKANTDPFNPLNFNPLRLTWDMHPERDMDWYLNMSQQLGPRRTAQEIDGDFLTSGNTVFDMADIRLIEELIEDMNPYRVSMNGSLVYNYKIPSNIRGAIGSDISTGRARDYSSFTLFDNFGKEYAYFKGKIPTDKHAELLMKVGKEANYALLAPESNDVGLAVTKLIQYHGYPNIYYSRKLLKEKGKSKPKIQNVPGWYTTSANRSVIIDELSNDLREGNIETFDKFFTDEAYTFIYDGANRPVASGKENKNGTDSGLDMEEEDFVDDAILGKAIANNVRKSLMYNSTVVAPK